MKETTASKEAEASVSVEVPLSRSDELKKWWDFLALVLFWFWQLFINDRQGNEAFVAKSYKQAIDLYTEALKVDPENAVLYSNRR